MDSGQDRSRAVPRLPSSAISGVVAVALAVGGLWWTANAPPEGTNNVPADGTANAPAGGYMAPAGGTAELGVPHPPEPRSVPPQLPTRAAAPHPLGGPTARSFAMIDIIDGRVVDEGLLTQLPRPAEGLVLHHGGVVTQEARLAFEGPAPAGGQLVLQVACASDHEIDVVVEISHTTHLHTYACEAGYGSFGPFTSDAGRAAIWISASGDAPVPVVFQLLQR